MKIISKIKDWSSYQIHKEYRKWIFLIFLGFILFLILSVINLGNFVLMGTGLAVFWYSIETFYLKQVQQKQLEHDRQALKIKRTVDLIEKFNTTIRLDYEYIIHPKFNFDRENLEAKDYKFIIENKVPPYEKMTPYLSLNNVLSFFEISGLMAKKDLIEIDMYTDFFHIVINKLFSHKEINKIIISSKDIDSSSWENAIYLHKKLSKK